MHNRTVIWFRSPAPPGQIMQRIASTLTALRARLCRGSTLLTKLNQIFCPLKGWLSFVKRVDPLHSLGRRVRLEAILCVAVDR